MTHVDIHTISCYSYARFSKLEVIFCELMAKNNFVNALILFIGVGMLKIISSVYCWKNIVTAYNPFIGCGAFFEL